MCLTLGSILRCGTRVLSAELRWNYEIAMKKNMQRDRLFTIKDSEDDGYKNDRSYAQIDIRK